MYFYYNIFSKHAADADTLLISLHTVYGRRAAAANSSKAMDLAVLLQVLVHGSGSGCVQPVLSSLLRLLALETVKRGVKKDLDVTGCCWFPTKRWQFETRHCPTAGTSGPPSMWYFSNPIGSRDAKKRRWH
jgi:hypothetical protein